MGPSRLTPARVSIPCRRPPCRAPNELDNPVAVAVDPFGSVYIADLAGELQRITRNCALSNPYFGAVSGVASDAQGNIYFSDPQHSVVWKLPAAPPPAGEAATPSLAYAAFVNAASLLTFDARFIQPAPAVCADLRRRTRRDGAHPRRVPGPLRPRSGEIRFHRHPAHHAGWRLRVVRSDARAADCGAGGGNLGRCAVNRRRQIFERDHSLQRRQRPDRCPGASRRARYLRSGRLDFGTGCAGGCASRCT